jgi:hypothetical protein
MFLHVGFSIFYRFFATAQRQKQVWNQRWLLVALHLLLGTCDVVASLIAIADVAERDTVPDYRDTTAWAHRIGGIVVVILFVGSEILLVLVALNLENAKARKVVAAGYWIFTILLISFANMLMVWSGMRLLLWGPEVFFPLYAWVVFAVVVLLLLLACAAKRGSQRSLSEQLEPKVASGEGSDSSSNQSGSSDSLSATSDSSQSESVKYSDSSRRSASSRSSESSTTSR